MVGTKPDFIILVVAKELVDGVNTQSNTICTNNQETRFDYHM